MIAPNQAPTIASLSDSPDPVTQGNNLALTANNVSDSDGLVVKVEFYRDVNNNSVIDVGTDALLGTDTNGFARFRGLARRAPEGQDYIRARVGWISDNRVRLGLPFDRYYMNEKQAPAAEKVYRKHSRGGAQDAYITVRVLSGFAVLEDLYVGGKPIREGDLSH